MSILSLIKRPLCIGAHPDDIEIGMGGTLYRGIHEFEWEAQLIVLTHVSDKRCKQAIDASLILGSKELYVASKNDDIPANCNPDLYKMIRLIEYYINKFKPDCIFTHTRFGNHQDHVATHEATMIAARREKKILCFEDLSHWRSGKEFSPQIYIPLDVNDYMQKMDACGKYRSESKKFDRAIRTLSMSRAERYGERYGEAFELMRWID